MAIGTYFTELLAYPITQASLLAEIDKLLKKNPGSSSIGNFVSYDTYNTTDGYGNKTYFQVYSIALSSSTYATVYCNVSVNVNLAVYVTWYMSWNVTTHTGTNASGQISFTTFNSLSNINCVNVYSSEYNFTILQQGTVVAVIGFVRPLNIKSTVSEPYCIFPTASDFTSWTSLAVHYFGTSYQTYRTDIGNSYLGSADPNNFNKRDSQPGINFYDNSNGIIWGKTSSDMVIMAASGTALFQKTADANNNIYRILSARTGGLAVATSS